MDECDPTRASGNQFGKCPAHSLQANRGILFDPDHAAAHYPGAIDNKERRKGHAFLPRPAFRRRKEVVNLTVREGHRNAERRAIEHCLHGFR